MNNFILPSWDEVQKRLVEFFIKWRGVDMSKHPALRNYNPIAYDSELFILNVAQFWGILPSKMSEVSQNDKVDIFAWYIAKHQIETIEHYEIMQRAKRK